MKYFSKNNNPWIHFPFCSFAFYINGKLECVLDYYHDFEVSIDEFIHSSRHYLARLFEVPWERIQLKLVDNVNGLAPFLPVEDSLTV